MIYTLRLNSQELETLDKRFHEILSGHGTALLGEITEIREGEPELAKRICDLFERSVVGDDYDDDYLTPTAFNTPHNLPRLGDE